MQKGDLILHPLDTTSPLIFNYCMTASPLSVFLVTNLIRVPVPSVLSYAHPDTIDRIARLLAYIPLNLHFALNFIHFFKLIV